MERIAGTPRPSLMGRAFAALLLSALAACGEDVRLPAAEPAGQPTPTVTTTAGPPHVMKGGPPPFLVRYDSAEIVLPASTYCYGSTCVDGWREHPPSVGSPDEVRIYVPVERFELDVSFQEGNDPCRARSTPAKTTALGDGWYALAPHGRAATYRVNLFASGGGDMVADFLWTTTSDGPLAQPSGELSLIADHDGKPDSYGIELGVRNLAATPKDASVRFTVTADNGRSIVLGATRSTDCVADGSVAFKGSEADGKRAAALGGFPFTTKVELTLDGTTYVAIATYPDDTNEEIRPGMPLTFEPPLPGLR